MSRFSYFFIHIYNNRRRSICLVEFSWTLQRNVIPWSAKKREKKAAQVTRVQNSILCPIYEVREESFLGSNFWRTIYESENQPLLKPKVSGDGQNPDPQSMDYPYELPKVVYP